MGRTGECKKRESVMRRENDCKPYIQSLCTAHLYSTKHTVVVIRSSFYMVRIRNYYFHFLTVCKRLVSLLN